MESKKIGYLIVSAIILLFVSGHKLKAQEKEKILTTEIIKSVFEKGLECCTHDQYGGDLDHYTGILMLHGMAEYSLLKGNKNLLQEMISYYKKFGTGEIQAKGNFISYEAGGSGAAYLAWKGATTVLDEQVLSVTKRMMEEQKRSPEGLMTYKKAQKGSDKVFIDVSFAVSPFLLYSGLRFNNNEYIDFAVFETQSLFNILKDKKTGLNHQARGFKQPGKLSKDCWSRGNGWGAFAISTLARDLPESHPRHEEIVELAKQFFTAVLRYQDKEGLWHQEMTNPSSYIETSGSGLLLYGLGIMLEKGILDSSYMENFRRGLQGYTSYISSDGSVSYTCTGCLSPGKGTKADYRDHPWRFNDAHAFGPVILAFTQAAKMGIEKIEPLKKLGYYNEVPKTYVTLARGKDVAWENDRIAYRVFGIASRGNVGSGIDIWAKSVDYPIIDNWYKLSEQGQSYHIDRGRGCDFYEMGYKRGCGALAIWIEGKPYPSETFDSFRISRNHQNDKIAFTLKYNTWNIPGLKIKEEKIVEMGIGTNLFKVTSTIKCDLDKELTIAVGLATFGNPEVCQNKKHRLLSVWEQIDEQHGSLGTAVLIQPKDFAGFASLNGDEFILLKVKTNTPFTYYSGAGWEKSKFFEDKNDWEEYLLKEAKHVKF